MGQFRRARTPRGAGFVEDSIAWKRQFAEQAESPVAERLHRDPKSERPEERVVAVHKSVNAPQNGDSPLGIAEPAAENAPPAYSFPAATSAAWRVASGSRSDSG
jgi:hypothetical protein